MTAPYLASGALFSPCRKYRYRLDRVWGEGPTVLWIMLNPSTADETKNDPTIERCERRARAAGFGRLLIGNIFALRSTDPKALYTHDAPEGAGNFNHVFAMAEAADLVICGWGNHGKRHMIGRAWALALEDEGYRPHALRLTKAGEPCHPLYVPYSVEPRPIVELMPG